MSQESSWHYSGAENIFAVGFWSEFIKSIRAYTEDAVEHLLLAAVAYLVICFVLYVVTTRWDLIEFTRDVKNSERILIVIAHPDDECMFFGPTIQNFVNRKNCCLYLMCMSTGKNYGMDKVRKRELYEACKVLGINEGSVMIYNHTLMPDSHSDKWPAELLGQLILRQVEVYDIDTLITFDKHGISRHSNHCSIYYAIAHLSIERSLPKRCRVFVLESVNILRKYWLLLDIPLSFLLSRYRFISTQNDRKKINEAMKKHKSQLVWFRRLYLIFSRYTIINTLQQMDISDIELDLEIDD
ncbi:hypothetical protein AMK59_8031 [Oryctes borbonicus]|uniref:N-acetylglucosaminylphosphatidylinositol deacetylase n=1 Tax=Oryctes borbonicus TaxID=1629725 RepID=A0A0T6AV82_9SCAR|nr:hypothetical protein AMK59_8031 [Oryctes borbonicus]